MKKTKNIFLVFLATFVLFGAITLLTTKQVCADGGCAWSESQNVQGFAHYSDYVWTVSVSNCNPGESLDDCCMRKWNKPNIAAAAIAQCTNSFHPPPFICEAPCTQFMSGPNCAAIPGTIHYSATQESWTDAGFTVMVCGGSAEAAAQGTWGWGCTAPV